MKLFAHIDEAVSILTHEAMYYDRASDLYSNADSTDFYRVRQINRHDAELQDDDETISVVVVGSSFYAIQSVDSAGCPRI